jgi:hypothetical protein
VCPVSAGGSLLVSASGGAAVLIPASGIWSLTEISADGPSSSPGLRAPISCLRKAPIAISKAAQTTRGGVSTAKSPNTPRPPSRHRWLHIAAGFTSPLASRQPLVRPPWPAPRGEPRQAPSHCHAPDLAWLRRGSIRNYTSARQHGNIGPCPCPRTLDRADRLVPRRPAHPLQVLPGLQPGLRH